MSNLINLLELGKVLENYNLTPQNKQQLVLLSKRKTSSLSAIYTIYRLARKLESKQLVVDQQQKHL